MTVGNFTELIKYACSALRLSDAEIESKFSDYPICITDCIDKGIRNKVIKIRFDEHSAILSVSFDNKNSCNLITLFPDTIEDIDRIILHLADYCDYDFLKSCWLLSNCYLKVKEQEEEVVFTFYC